MDSTGNQELFPFLPLLKAPSKSFGDQGYPVWSKNKSKLIERYLYYFIMVTRNGAYIDGFAGPQRDNDKTLWSAKRVLEREPRWLTNFVLCDVDPRQVEKLKELKDAQPPRNKEKKERTRSISVLQGDFNEIVDQALTASNISGNKKAAFCLLDQRTFECHWATVKRVAEYRPKQRVELFYLLPIGWLQRSLAATKDTTRLATWWGRSDWTKLRKLSPTNIAALMCDRFRKELGYEFAQAWPIRQSQKSRRIMYFMVHATDHPEAPKLMRRAFKKTDSRIFENVQTMDIEDFLAREKD